MAISVAATSYIAQQAYSLPSVGGTRSQANTPPGPQTDPLNSAQVNANKDRQLQEARKKDPAAEITSHPGYTFETDSQNRRIMKVSDNKGVLIYQVPSKGELALVEAQDASKQRLALTA